MSVAEFQLTRLPIGRTKSAFGKKCAQSKRLVYDETIEAAINKIQDQVEALFQGKFNSRWVALRLLDGDTTIIEEMLRYLQRIQLEEWQYPKKCKVVEGFEWLSLGSWLRWLCPGFCRKLY